MLGMLREMVAVRRRAREDQSQATQLLGTFPQRVHFIWSCRSTAEFALLDADLLAEHE